LGNRLPAGAAVVVSDVAGVAGAVIACGPSDYELADQLGVDRKAVRVARNLANPTGEGEVGMGAATAGTVGGPSSKPSMSA
jgi:hypothetical protein